MKIYFSGYLAAMTFFSGYLAAMTFGAEEIVDLQPQVDNVGQVASQKDDDDDEWRCKSVCVF